MQGTFCAPVFQGQSTRIRSDENQILIATPCKKLFEALGYEIRKLQAQAIKSDGADHSLWQPEVGRVENDAVIANMLAVLESNGVEAYESAFRNEEFMRYYAESTNEFHKELANIVGFNSVDSMIDVGCGGGHFLAECSRTINCKLYGIELSATGVALTRRFGPWRYD